MVELSTDHVINDVPLTVDADQPLAVLGFGGITFLSKQYGIKKIPRYH